MKTREEALTYGVILPGHISGRTIEMPIGSL